MKNTFSLQSNNQILAKRHDTGLILHLYYPEMWEEILSYLNNLGEDFDLFVTIPYEVDFSENQITSKYPDAHIYRCENRGRDVAPFLAIFSLISSLGYKYLCKIHTKRNMQLVPEVNWRQDVLSKLLGSPQIILDIKAAFDNHTDWGVVAPQGHVVPSKYFLSQNATLVNKLARSIGIAAENIEFSYVAGTMFWFQPKALDQVLRTDINFQEFASEQGQQDATLAHALERFFGLAVTYAGYKIAESDSQEVKLANVSLHFRALSHFYEDLQQEYLARGSYILALEKDIFDLQQENKSQVEHISKLEQEGQSAKQQILMLESDIHTRDKEIQNLKLSISSIYQSTSWRITEPIRSLKTIAQKVMSRIRGSSETKPDPATRSPADFRSLVVEPSTFDRPRNADIQQIPFQITRVVDRNKISVIITSYNHERYIKQCLDSILDQKGNYDLEIILGDDCSTDNTRVILQDYYKKYPHVIKMMPEQSNIGITKNLKRCLDACQGDFIAICEGDDYWTDEFKLQKQMKYLEDHQDCSMCFSAFMLFYEEENKLIPFADQVSLNKDVITTEDLIRKNYIGNFSCCMYRTDLVRKLPAEIFDVFTVDWMFNMACGELGGIGFIRDYMSVYRKHSQGAWSGKSVATQVEELLPLIDNYDKLFHNKYHDQFTSLKRAIDEYYYQNDLLILDTVFPQSRSSFRSQEFTSLLDYFTRSKVLTTGEHIGNLSQANDIWKAIEEFEKEHTEYKGKVIVSSYDIDPYHAKLAYVVSLKNTDLFLSALERKQIPFIFALYPREGFLLDGGESDDMLQRVTSSLYFRKVIVTQKITHDYLINKGFCKPDQIKLIYGAVVATDLLTENPNKKHFGFEKNTLDVCFIAQEHKGQSIDKDYNVFIDTAKRLRSTSFDIHFHVVSYITEADLPVNGLEDKISFYGLGTNKRPDNFYLDKDIIIYLNDPFKAMNGLSDDFLATSCIEAGLQKVAVFCTNELGINSKFIDGEDMIVIHHDSEEITKLLKFYYSNPVKLRKIADTGAAKFRDVYSYENQVLPRIRILETELGTK